MRARHWIAFALVAIMAMSPEGLAGSISFPNAGGSGGGLTPETTRTLNVTAGMTAAQVQALIDSVGKCIPQGQTVTIQFADGTYTFSASVTIAGFICGGTLKIAGNQSETTALHTNQAVIITPPSGLSAFSLTGNQANILFDRVRFSWTGSAEGVRATRTWLVSLTGCYINGSSNVLGSALTMLQSMVYAETTNFSNTSTGIWCRRGSDCTSNGNATTGTAPGLPLYAEGGTMRKNTAGDPTCSAAASSGGQCL